MRKEVDKTFSKIFFENEYKDLAGHHGAVIKRLVLLLSITLTALGFAVGGLKQLKQRMDNPFTNWVDMVVSPNVEKKLPALRNHFLEQDSLNKYHLEGRGEWNEYYLAFQHRSHNPITFRKDSLTYLRRGRTLEFEGDLFNEIVKPGSKNLIYRDDSAFDESSNVVYPCGIIVTESVMSKLGYTPKEYDSVKHLSVSFHQGSDIIFLRLIAVVEQLPSLCSFVTTAKVWGIKEGEFGDYLIRNAPSDSTSIRLLSDKSIQGDMLKVKVAEELGVSDAFDLAIDSLLVDGEKTFFTYIIRINRDVAPSMAKIKDFIQSLKLSKSFTDYSYLDCGDDAGRIDNPHNITFNFRDLNEIRQFQHRLSSDHDIELTMEQVESRENFRLVSRLTTIMGVVLFGFGLLSILLYLGNLIHGHVLKIKTNLGTFKAMGLQNVTLIGTYTNIVLKLLFVALLLSLPLAFLIGWASDRYWLGVGFSFVHWSIPFVILLVFGVTYYLIHALLKRILMATPGDLIYERLND